MNGRELGHDRAQMHCTNWGGLVLQASVNLKEGLECPLVG